MKEKIKNGTIVRFDITNRHFSDDGFALGGIGLGKNRLYLYEKIDLEDFPSFRDFKGSRTIITHGDYGMILKYIGRPFKISQNPKWLHYDIYEVLTSDSSTRQVFKFNICES